MKAICVAFHSFVLLLADLAGIGAGAVAAFKALGIPNQVWLQLPIAVVLTVVFFSTWTLCLRVSGFKRLQLLSVNELRACLVASMLWAPLVFVPLHYFTQGYLTSLGNLVALALYQVPVNALALFVSSLLQSTRAKAQKAPAKQPIDPTI